MPAQPLSLGSKLSYGVGQTAEGLANGAFGAFVLFYYNQVLGLAATWAGLALGIALIFDAFVDPMMGSISDHWRSRLGRRHPFMYAASLPLALSFYLLFAPPQLGATGLFCWLTATAIGVRLSITLFQVPHTALGAELSQDFVERTSVVAYRQFFSSIGGFAAFAIGFGYFFATSPDEQQGQFDASAYPYYALVLAALMALSTFISARGTQSRVPLLHQPPGAAVAMSAVALMQRMLIDTRDGLKNRSFRWLIIGVLIAFLMVGVDGALNLYMNTFFWELASDGQLLFFIATPLGLMLGYPFTAKFHLWFDKRATLVWGTACWAGGQIIPVVLRIVGWFPDNGTELLLETLVVIKFVQGLGMAQAAVSFGSMVADIADEHELTMGKRQEGVFFAVVSFANKATTGLGSIIAGIALDLISWPRGANIQHAADVPAAKIMQLGIVYGPVVAGCGIFALYCYGRYALTRPIHADIVRQLAQRKALLERG